MTSFQQRVENCIRSGRLTVGDLSYWFDRPYSTVRAWVKWGNDPQGPSGEEAYRLLALLEQTIKARRGASLVPPNTSVRIRHSEIERIRRELDGAPIPAARAAR
jgi:hypothetical protein